MKIFTADAINHSGRDGAFSELDAVFQKIYKDTFDRQEDHKHATAKAKEKSMTMNMLNIKWGMHGDEDSDVIDGSDDDDGSSGSVQARARSPTRTPAAAPRVSPRRATPASSSSSASAPASASASASASGVAPEEPLGAPVRKRAKAAQRASSGDDIDQAISASMALMREGQVQNLATMKAQEALALKESAKCDSQTAVNSALLAYLQRQGQ